MHVVNVKRINATTSDACPLNENRTGKKKRRTSVNDAHSGNMSVALIHSSAAAASSTNNFCYIHPCEDVGGDPSESDAPAPIDPQET